MDHGIRSSEIDNIDLPRPRRRRRSRPARASRPARSLLRAFYFGLASLWGYAIGAAALFLGLRAAGQTVAVDRSLTMLVVPGAVLAFVGGLISAAAYRQARRRMP